MTEDDIRELLKLGEYERLECKAAAGGLPKSIWETYSSFANTVGGVILLGVEEIRKEGRVSYRVVGLDKPELRVRDIWNTVNNTDKVSRNILSNQDIGVVRVNGADVLWIQVPPVAYTDRPVYCGRNPFTGTYKRNHEGDYRCTEQEVQGMLRDSTPNADSELQRDYSVEDLDEASVKAYRNQFQALHPGHTWNSLPDDDFLRMLHAWQQDRISAKACLTTAGLLMFGQGIAVQECFPALRLDYMDRTNAGHNERWRDRVTFDGTWEYNLFNFVSIVLPRITRDIARPFIMDGVTRIDDTTTHKAIREALINMLVHCDYHAGGVVVATKDDTGFRFRNPGTPLIPVADVYAGGTTSTRNPQIQTIFRLIGLGESAGSGFPMILDTWQRQGWRMPDLSDNSAVLETDLRLWTLPAFNRELETQAAKIIDGYEGLSQKTRQIISSMLAEDGATTERVARLIGLPRSRTLSLMSELEAHHIIYQEDSGQWVLNRNKESDTQGTGVSPVQHQQTSAAETDIDQKICAAIAARQEASSRDVAAATGYALRTVQRSLKHLLDLAHIRKKRKYSHVLAPSNRSDINSSGYAGRFTRICVGRI